MKGRLKFSVVSYSSLSSYFKTNIGKSWVNKLSQYLAYSAQRAWLCIKLAFGHQERKALPLEKINNASQISLPFNYKGQVCVKTRGWLPSCAILLPAFGTEALWPGQLITNPLLCNTQCHLFIGFCHTHIVKGNFVLHLQHAKGHMKVKLQMFQCRTQWAL